MTERTFRSPSPNTPQDRLERPASSHGPYPRYDHDDAPPVPALPKNLASVPPQSQTMHRRPASVEPPQRISSPPPREPGGRGVSLDRGPRVMAPPSTKAKIKKTLDSVDETELVGHRSSVNFSRPMSPQNSPPASPLASGRVRSSPPTKTTPTTALANGEADPVAVSLLNTAAAPVKKKKKVTANGSAEGSNLAAGTDCGPPIGTAVDRTPQRQALSTTSARSPATGSQAGDVNEAPQPKKKKKKKKAAHTGETQPDRESFGAAYSSDTDSVTSERSSSADRPRSYNTRAAGLLAKQPSMVREDPEGEEQAEGTLQGPKTKAPTISNGSALASTPANTSKLVSKDRQHHRSASQQGPTNASKLDVPSAVRPVSLSPGRAAHFPAQPVNEGTKHQPPGRSVSPAKSALKNSPSRGHSPIVTRRGLAPSDASDSTSQYSDDGSRSSGKKKKKNSARVSFDDGLVVVGRAASPPLIPDSPPITSPQNKSAKTRTWIDLIREQNQESVASEQDFDSAIKPTPALPSFGSVRGREQKSSDEAAEQAFPSEDWATNTLRSMDTSTDTVVGQVIAADAAAKQAEEELQPPANLGPKDPLPPQVTSVEGSGYHSDEDDLFDEGDKKVALTQSYSPPERQTDVQGEHIQSLQSGAVTPVVEQPGAHVPSIAVQPATPGLESALANRDSWLGMPGGFPSQKENERETASKTDPAGHQTPATVGIAEPEPEAVAAQHDSSAPIVGDVAQTLRTQIDAASGDESEDTAGDSIYSDAAEDQSDLEGDGFGSINAIVESPTSPNIALAGRSPPASPGKAPKERFTRPEAVERRESELSEPASGEGWDRAQAYWSGLSQTRKQQLEQAALPGAIDEPVIRNRSMRGADAVHKKKKTKKVPPQPLSNNKTPQQILSSAHPPKSSMRPSSPPIDSAPHLRSSMRDGPPKPVSKNEDKRSSLMLQPIPKAALQKKSRPVSAVAMVDHNRTEQRSLPNDARAVSATTPAASKTPVPVRQQKQFPTTKPKVQRANSDSDSSFKKAWPKTPDGSRYKMKRSMRGQSNEPAPNRPSSMVGRTASPVDSIPRRPFSSIGPSGAGSMRTSMRGSTDVSKPARTSLRISMDSSKASRTKSPSRFSFMSSSKAKSITTESKPTSRFSSRFGDSSDEEQGLPTMSSSRFADSSDDDDEPEGLTPVRGIPRRIDEGDSTDLEDSSEEKAPAPAKSQAEAIGTNGTQALAVASPQGAALATGSLRTAFGAQPPMATMGMGLQAKKSAEKDKKKSSFFGSLSRRKRDDSSRAQKSDIESPARRDAPIERTKAERMTIIPEAPRSSGGVLEPSSPIGDPTSTRRLDTTLPAGSKTSLAQSSPKSPKLQRRNTPKTMASSNDISWPLPQSSADTVVKPPRPRTSDGPAARKDDIRPSLVLRHSVQAPVRSPGVNGAASGSVDPAAKKKKFSMLKKAFGLQG